MLNQILKQSLQTSFRNISYSPVVCSTQLTTRENKYDVAIIGGGIIGTSIGRKIREKSPNLKTVILEKESSLAKHQSSHNSGVLHCGIYYRPGSLKAKFCIEGLEQLEKYCQEKNIPVKTAGKLIVANTDCDINNLKCLHERGQQNQIQNIQYLCTTEQIRKKVPSSRGIEAVWVPKTGNVNFKAISDSLLQDFLSKKGQIQCNYEVTRIENSGNCNHPVLIVSKENECLSTRFLIICGGLHSENLTKMVEQCPPKEKTLSLYVNYKILKKRCDEIKCNIYTVPDLEVPFLGPHISPMQNGDVLLGPWTFPALKTEGYSNEEVNLPYLKDLLTSCAFRNMVMKNLGKCIDQATKTFITNFQIRDLQKLYPEIPYQEIQNGPTAVQCQMFEHDGTFVDDFIFDVFCGDGIRKNVINCKYVPSPGATSCLAIADFVSDELTKKL